MEAGMEKSISQTSPWQMKIIIGLRATRNGLGGRVLTMGDHSCIVKSTLASQTGGKGVVSANDGRASKTVWRVFGESNWQEGGSKCQ